MRWLGVLYWNHHPDGISPKPKCENLDIIQKMFYDEYVERYHCFEDDKEGNLELWLVENLQKIHLLFEQFKNSDYLKIIEIK